MSNSRTEKPKQPTPRDAASHPQRAAPSRRRAAAARARHTASAENAGTSVMKLDVLRAKPGRASTTSTQAAAPGLGNTERART